MSPLTRSGRLAKPFDFCLPVAVALGHAHESFVAARLELANGDLPRPCQALLEHRGCGLHVAAVEKHHPFELSPREFLEQDEELRLSIQVLEWHWQGSVRLERPQARVLTWPWCVVVVDVHRRAVSHLIGTDGPELRERLVQLRR